MYTALSSRESPRRGTGREADTANGRVISPATDCGAHTKPAVEAAKKTFVAQNKDPTVAVDGILQGLEKRLGQLFSRLHVAVAESERTIDVGGVVRLQHHLRRKPLPLMHTSRRSTRPVEPSDLARASPCRTLSTAVLSKHLKLNKNHTEKIFLTDLLTCPRKFLLTFLPKGGQTGILSVTTSRAGVGAHAAGDRGLGGKHLTAATLRISSGVASGWR
jgi:hypothetical protein